MRAVCHLSASPTQTPLRTLDWIGTQFVFDVCKCWRREGWRWRWWWWRGLNPKQPAICQIVIPPRLPASRMLIIAPSINNCISWCATAQRKYSLRPSVHHSNASGRIVWRWLGMRLSGKIEARIMLLPHTRHRRYNSTSLSMYLLGEWIAPTFGGVICSARSGFFPLACARQLYAFSHLEIRRQILTAHTWIK